MASQRSTISHLLSKIKVFFAGHKNFHLNPPVKINPDFMFSFHVRFLFSYFVSCDSSRVLMPLIFFSTWGLGSMTCLAQPRHFSLKSAPILRTSHSKLPHGCFFLSFKICPSRISICSSPCSLYFNYTFISPLFKGLYEKTPTIGRQDFHFFDRIFTYRQYSHIQAAARKKFPALYFFKFPKAVSSGANGGRSKAA